jgi:hypothetical protein
MIYAQILNTIIVNIIELDDSSLASQFAIGYDSCLEIDQLTPTPQIGWYYDGTNYWPPVTLALIQSGNVVSIIQNFEPYISANASSYQYIIDITTMYPQPQVGWTYNGTTFIPSLAYYQNLIMEASVFGSQLINTFAATNVSEGITQAGMTNAVINYTQNLYLALTTGSLYQAISIIQGMIADTSSAKVGAYATGTGSSLLSGTITFTANTLGIVGNSISLTFSGLNSVSTVCSAWNTANPSNQVSYSSASTAIPESGTVTLSGGVNTLAPYITNTVLNSYLTQIEQWLTS